MTKTTASDEHGSSTRPYLIRGLHEWCTDNGFTPYIAVFVSPAVQVPLEYVKNHEIVLNIGFEATSGLKMGNDFIEFKARFGGVTREIIVPVDHVVAIYARENGQGMAFPVPAPGGGEAVGAESGPDGERGGLRLATQSAESDASPPGRGDADGPEPPTPPAPGRPALKRVK